MKNIRIVAAIILAGLITVGTSAACSCSPVADTFFETVTKVNQRSPGELTVVIGRVMKHMDPNRRGIPTVMSFAVEHVLQGDVPSNVIKIQGDDGISCMPYVTNFPEGSTWALAIFKHKGERANAEYYISICGKFWQPIALPPAP